MRYLDVCAGISASSVAWKPLGWESAAYSEIEAAPRAVLEHRQGALPVGWDHRHVAGSNTTPLFGDFTQIEAHHVGPIDLLVGGTPCQDFSVAGLRAGLDGDRGNLSLEFLRLADRTRPRWVVWENVPGVLSINGGRAFGAILGGLGELGYGFGYRVLDAQHFGVPQRRRRVFVVGYLGDHRRAGAVLFERNSMSGHSAPCRGARQGTAHRIARSLAIRGREGTPSAELGDELANAILTPSGGRAGIGVGATLIEAFGGNNTRGPIDVSTALNSHGGPHGGPHGRLDFESETFVAHAIQAGALRENPESGPDGIGVQVDCAYTLEARAEVQAVGFYPTNRQPEFGNYEGVSPAVKVGSNSGGNPPGVAIDAAVRRLTPRECERLQGFPDDYTLVPNRGKPMADGPRYKCLGNSMAVPVMRWIGERIDAVEALQHAQRDAA